MLYKTLLMVHISSAAIGIFAGFLAMVFRKGSGLHGAAGAVFFAAMLGMGGCGAFLAAFLRPNIGNVLAGLLVVYLVSTAWIAAKRRDWKTGVIDFGSLIFILAIITAEVTFGFKALRSTTGVIDGYGPVMFFVFAAIETLFAQSDLRLILRGGISNAQRIRRHLWRMSITLLFATASFYPGQGKLFPRWLRDTNLLYIPHVLLIGAMFFYLYRYSARRRAQRKFVPVIGNLELQAEGAAR